MITWVEIEIITGPRDLVSGVWPTDRQFIRADAVELIYPDVSYDPTVCGILLNSKLPPDRKNRSPIQGVAALLINESMDSIAKRTGIIVPVNPQQISAVLVSEQDN
jgi:hypothetical protein